MNFNDEEITFNKGPEASDTKESCEIKLEKYHLTKDQEATEKNTLFSIIFNILGRINAMKKISVMFMVLIIMSVSMIGCKKDDGFSEEASIKSEIKNELSAEDKKEINEALGEEFGFGVEEEAAKTEEPEGFSADDFPCDQVVLNSKWSDCYYQVADVIVQEYHNVPIMEVVEAFENSKLKFKPDYFNESTLSYEDFDFEQEFPINNSDVKITMNSEYGSVALKCSIDKESSKDDIVKIKDAYFTYIENVSFSSSYEELENCQYITKGFCAKEGVASEYTYRDLDKILDDDIVEVESEPLKITDIESSYYICNPNNMYLQIYSVIPDDIISGGSGLSNQGPETAVRKRGFDIGDNNCYRLKNMDVVYYKK